MNEKLTFEAFYPHPPSRVWQALTDPAALAKWLLPTNFRPRIGFRFRFDGLGRGENSSVSGRVLEAEEGKRLTYEWDDGEAGSPSVVTWTLQPKDGGTLLRLEHVAEAEPEPYVLIEAELNWRYALYASLPVMLMVLREGARRPSVPMVYVAEEPEAEGPKRRAGFRQEEAVTCQ